MRTFYKKDIPILNAILHVALKMKKPHYANFNINKKDFTELDNFNSPSSYFYYLEIIQDFDVAKFEIGNNTFQIWANERTVNFLQNGNGFEGIYNDNIEIESQEKQLRKLNINHLQKSIFQLKYWWMFLLINILLSFIVSYLTSKLIK